MRHQNANRKFGRERDQRKALVRSLVRSLILHGKIKTTITKARGIRPIVEKFVTRAKNPTQANYRPLAARIGSVSTVAHLVKEVAPKYAKRAGGYTRIAKLSNPRHDGSMQAVIEFV